MKLQTRATMIATIYIVLATVLLIWHVTVILVPREEVPYELLSSSNQETDAKAEIPLYAYKIFASLEFIYLITNILVVYGAKTESRYYLLPWLVITAIYKALFIVTLLTNPFGLHFTVPLLLFGLNILPFLSILRYYRSLLPQNRKPDTILIIEDRNLTNII